MKKNKKDNAFIPMDNSNTREKEDQPKFRATKRREEKAARQAEASARKASVRLLAKQEEEDLERMLNLKKKETAEELQRKSEEELATIQKKVEEEKRKQSRVATKKEYEKMILVENKNRSVIEAHRINEAIAVLTGKENLQVCKVKAAEGNKGDCLFVYTQGEEKPLLVDVRLIV